MAESAPDIASSSRMDRLWYVKSKYPCIADCDQCGLCASFHGKDPTIAFKDYIDGKASFMEVSLRYR